MSVLATDSLSGNEGQADDIKQVPQDQGTREAIRAEAATAALAMPRGWAPALEDLRPAAREILTRLGLPGQFLGFAMVALDNAFWGQEFRSVPFERRLLLLPKCLSDPDACQGEYDSVGLNCARCGACAIHDLEMRAEKLGYQIVVAEGTSSVIMQVLEGRADAVLGVACLDSLEKSFERISDLGIPHQAIPLLTDGCSETKAEIEQIVALIDAVGKHSGGSVRSYLPLLRATHSIFEPKALRELIGPASCAPPTDLACSNPVAGTDSIAFDFLQDGGKRLRPFVTVAAYAVGKHGLRALDRSADSARLIPAPVHFLAAAIEALHKASLVHDDIEDLDLYRYGKPTVHQEHGVPIAINVGDYLVGLGYRLIASQSDALGAECAADILGKLAEAQLRLCCGQGEELSRNEHPDAPLTPLDVLQIGAFKTAPAFEVALYAGLRAAGVAVDQDLLARYAMYVGEAYQVYNDLADWETDEDNKVSAGQDVLAKRPTIVRAFAISAGARGELDAILTTVNDAADPDVAVEQVRAIYTRTRAFELSAVLYARLRQRALAVTEEVESPALQELLRFLVRNVLRPARELPGAS